jgi:hypothetical protein
MTKPLELVVGNLYHHKELEEHYKLNLTRFYTSRSIFADSEGKGYLFVHEPLQRLKIRFKYDRPFILNSNKNEIYTEYEAEKDLNNCCGPARLGILDDD